MIRLVIMAAGKASRMGRDKLGLPLENMNVLSWVLTSVLKAMGTLQNKEQNCKISIELVVVARNAKEEYLSSDLCKEFAEVGGIWRLVEAGKPLALNIQAGLVDYPAAMTGIGFLPGDQIGLKSKQLAGLLRYFFENTPDFLIPLAGDTPGSPVIFHRKYVPELQALAGEQGGKVIISRYQDKTTYYPVDPDFLIDLDTPEDYELYISKVKGGKS